MRCRRATPPQPAPAQTAPPSPRTAPAAALPGRQRARRRACRACRPWRLRSLGPAPTPPTRLGRFGAAPVAAGFRGQGTVSGKDERVRRHGQRHAHAHSTCRRIPAQRGSKARHSRAQAHAETRAHACARLRGLPIDRHTLSVRLSYDQPPLPPYLGVVRHGVGLAGREHLRNRPAAHSPHAQATLVLVAGRTAAKAPPSPPKSKRTEYYQARKALHTQTCTSCTVARNNLPCEASRDCTHARPPYGDTVRSSSWYCRSMRYTIAVSYGDGGSACTAAIGMAVVKIGRLRVSRVCKRW
jgi:hypothetical protein